MKNLSIKVKIIGVSILLPSLLLIALFAAYIHQTKQDAIEVYVDKARSITIAAESTREGMENLFHQGGVYSRNVT